MQADGVIKGRVIYADTDQLIVARGEKLLSSSNGGKDWALLVRLPVGWLKTCFMRFPLLARLFRLGVHHLVKVDSKIVVIANKESYLIEGRRVTYLGRVNGSRPMALCGSAEGVFYGEYRSNPERSPVHVWKLDFQRNAWRSVQCFDGVRHIHGVFYDRYEKSLWVTTGDTNSEAAIWRSDDGFKSVRKVASGSQQFRAVQLLFTANHVYFGSDAPDERNFLYRMDRNGNEVERLAPVGGSVFYGCRFRDKLFFSTAVEPSKVNSSKEVEVWYSQGGEAWRKVATYPKDPFPMKYFQYGQALFPCVPEHHQGPLYFMPFATKGHGQTYRFEL